MMTMVISGSDGVTFPDSTNQFSGAYFGFKNRLINGDYSVAQRGTSFASGANDNDTYNLDRWYVLSDGNDAVDITQDTTTVPTNQLTALALDVETEDKKFGIAQIIEQVNCIGLIGNTVNLSFKAKVSSTTKLDNVKCAIVAWSGTANTVTSDIISAWGAEGTNPTLIADATYENSPANLNLTTSYATYSVSAAVDTASTKNIIVFIWSDVTDTTAGDFLFITDVQLEVGSVATPFERRPFGTELALCYRYYYKQKAAAQFDTFGAGLCDTTTVCQAITPFPVLMRVSPTALEQSGTAGDYLLRTANTNPTCSAVPTFSIASPFSATYNFTVASGLTAGQAIFARGNNTSAFLAWSAEL
jgi:hypothetical protein